EQMRRVAELEATLEAKLENIASKDRELTELLASLEEVRSIKDSQLMLIYDRDNLIKEAHDKLQFLDKKLIIAEERVLKIKDTAKHGIDNMKKNFDFLKNVVEHLKSRYESSVASMHSLRDELDTLRTTSSNCVKELEPFMDPSHHHLVKANETRDLIQELQMDRNNSQQVISFLRDKLHSVSTQLAEANEKVVDLENFRKQEGSSLARSAGLWQATGQQVQEITSKLMQREREDATLLSEGLKFEMQLKDANKKYIR
ncbi:hypothetical protein BDP27DRAFT_1213889, partial [Rhodocollybia butyracea]